MAGLGKILPEGEVVTVAPPFGAGDARIAVLHVQEGDRVERGALLAVLDNERQLLSAVEAARATVDARAAMLEQTRTVTAAAREEAWAALARAESTAQNALREFERVEAGREVERLRATLSRYGAGAIDAQADVVVAMRNLDSARADLARAEAEREKAYVRAPVAGTILSIANRPGERPATTGMMNLGDLEHMKVEVEVYQTQIGQVAIGDPVEVTAEALPKPLRGTVRRIGLEVGRQSLVDPNPAANTDARVVKVTAGLDAPSTPLAARFTNLQVTARIQSGAGPTAP